MAPWDDLGLTFASMNDAYQIEGMRRADEFYDIHPADHFHFIPPPVPGQPNQMVYAHTIPPGYYVRPARHLEWIATQTIPIWMHPDHAKQVPESATWPSVRAFPRAAIEDAFGRYFTSTPAWMMAHAILRGAKEMQIFGIHLSSESEYIEQRPNFEYLCGRLLGPQKMKTTLHQGLRRYETADGLLVLPEQAPVLGSAFQYAFETSPRRHLEPLKWEMHKVQVKRDRRLQALKQANPWKPWVTFMEPDKTGTPQPKAMLTSTLQAELTYYDALLADWQDQIQRKEAGL